MPLVERGDLASSGPIGAQLLQQREKEDLGPKVECVGKDFIARKT